MRPLLLVFVLSCVVVLATASVEKEKSSLKSDPKPLYHSAKGNKNKFEIFKKLRAKQVHTRPNDLHSEQVHIRPGPNHLDSEQVHIRPKRSGKFEIPTLARLERAPKKEDRIPGEYIVVLKDSYGEDKVHDMIATLSSRRRNIAVKSIYTKVLKGFSIAISDDDQALLDRIRSLEEVSYVEENGVVRASEVEWGLDRIDQRDLPLDGKFQPGGDGSGVVIYVLDTGIRPSHEEFSGRAKYLADFIDNTFPDDPNGHGTHVAGTAAGKIYGVAKGASIEALRVLDGSGSGSTLGIINALELVGNQNNYPKGIVSMSLGGGFSTSFNNAVAALREDGYFVAVAAGNEDQAACNTSPSSTEIVITVGSSTENDQRSSFSNFGNCVDIFAPGSSIRSAWPSSDTASAILSGTSMATPFVSGVAAVLWARDPSMSVAQLENKILSEATSNKLSNPGTGSPNLLLFLPEPTDGPDPGPDPTTEGPDPTTEGPDPTTEGTGYEPPFSVGDTICFDDCPNWAQDGYCDDGGDGHDTDWCAYGRDCADCGGPREVVSCENYCYWAYDGICDDGGPGSFYSDCTYGTDCYDCGERELNAC